MGCLRRRIKRYLEKVTCDKYELNRFVLKYKKRFQEAGSVLHDPKRK